MSIRQSIGKRLPLLGALTLGAILSATLYLFAWVDHARMPAPDSEYSAVVQVRRYRMFVPSMPGQSGDKPGRLVLVNPAGETCGAIKLPMANMAYDAEWDSAGVHVRLLGQVAFCD